MKGRTKADDAKLVGKGNPSWAGYKPGKMNANCAYPASPGMPSGGKAIDDTKNDESPYMPSPDMSGLSATSRRQPADMALDFKRAHDAGITDVAPQTFTSSGIRGGKRGQM